MTIPNHGVIPEEAESGGSMGPRIKSEDDGGWGNIVLNTSVADAGFPRSRE
jgi:hypothetical protein